MEPAPRLLRTYQEARLLFEAKGWALAKAAEHLSELPELARFHISHTKLSKKTTPSKAVLIEPEVAAAIEGLKTWSGRERQTEIVIAGLRAAHADRPAVGVRARLPAGQRAWWFLRRLAGKLGRLSWRPVAVTAASGALVGCLALVALAPFLPRQADAAFQPGPLVVMVPAIASDDSPVQLWFEPGALLALSDPRGPKRPAEQYVPKSTLPGQRVAPCDEGLRQEAIYGNCWIPIVGAPPCGRLFRHGDKCYAPVAAEAKKPAP